MWLERARARQTEQYSLNAACGTPLEVRTMTGAFIVTNHA
jgi:hypothetical protein